MEGSIINRAKPIATAAEQAIYELARRHNVTYQETELDRLGNAITRLAGDDGILPEPSRLILALERAGHLSKVEANKLHGAYLRAKYE